MPPRYLKNRRLPDSTIVSALPIAVSVSSFKSAKSDSVFAPLSPWTVAAVASTSACRLQPVAARGIKTAKAVTAAAAVYVLIFRFISSLLTMLTSILLFPLLTSLTFFIPLVKECA